jgi:co-chaperonin GroES (HSP10)
MKAVGKRLIIEKIKEGTTETKGGLLLAESHRDDIRYIEANVLSIGDEVVGVKEGDRIFYDRHAGHKIDIVRVENREYQYLYQEDADFIFMNNETFEQVNIPSKMVEKPAFLLEGMICNILYDANDEVPMVVELPMYIISTRDCFVFDLNVKVEEITYEGRKIIKKEYFFDKSTIPSNYHKFQNSKDDLRVGCVTYENFYTHEELNEIEKCVHIF